MKCPKSLGIFFFAGLTWACWRIRNKMAIDKIFSKPSDVIYSGISYLQTWKPLLKEKDAKQVKQMVWSMLEMMQNRIPAL